MAQTTSLVFNGGVIPSPSPAPAGSGKAKLLKIGEITITEQEVQVTKKVICDPDSVTTVAPFMEVLTSARLAELISANSILVLDDGTVQYLMADATVVVEDGTPVCTSVSFLGLSLEDRAKVLYPCTRITDELTLQQVLEVGEPVETGFDLVKAYPEDTEAGTLIDKLMVEDTVQGPDDQTLLEVVQGDQKVAINEDNLRNNIDNIYNSIDGIIETIDEMDVDSVPRAYLASTLNQSPGDNVSTRTTIDVFSVNSIEGDCFEFEQTTTIDDTPFGYVWIEPGTYLINAAVTLQWVGNPRGTFIAKVGSVMGENFDFSQEQEISRQSTKVVTIPNRMKLAVNVTYDAETPVMGFWIQSMQVVKLAGGMSQTNIIHDNTLVGHGSLADPLGVDEEKVAQSTLAGNLAPEFIPNSTTIVAGHPYMYGGSLYVAKESGYQGTWDASKFIRDTAMQSYLQKYYDAAASCEKKCMPASEFAHISGFVWDGVTGVLRYTGANSCSDKLDASLIKSVYSTKNMRSITLYYENGNISYILDLQYFTPSDYSGLKAFAVNFKNENLVDCAVLILSNSSISSNYINLGAVRQSSLNFSAVSVFEQVGYCWDVSTGDLTASYSVVGSCKFLLSKYKSLTTVNSIISDLLLFKADHSFDVVHPDRTDVDLTQYANTYAYFCFNFPRNPNTLIYLDEHVRLAPDSNIYSKTTALSAGTLVTLSWQDFIIERNWGWRYQSGEFCWFGLNRGTSSKKYKLADFDYISTDVTPSRAFLFRADGTFEQPSPRNFYDCGYLELMGFSEIAFTFSKSDLEKVQLTLKLKSKAHQSSEKENYYFIPNVEEVGSIDDIDNITSDEFVERFYEPLRAKYPTYVTRRVIGKDASDNYDMYVYEFTPEGGYDYSVYLQAGVHGNWEQQGYAGLATLIRMICDSYETKNAKLSMVRSRVRLVVVPIVNVWDVTQWALYNSGRQSTHPSIRSRNANGVNLNRDWNSTPPQQEVTNVKNTLSTYTDIVFGFDCHTDPEGIPGWGAYLLSYATGTPEFWGNILKRVCSYLYVKNPIRRTNVEGQTILLYKAYEGDAANYPINSDNWRQYAEGLIPDYTRAPDHTGTFTGGIYTDYGILMTTLEHNGFKFGVGCDSRELCKAVELYGCQLIEMMRCDVKEKFDIYKLQHS